MSVSVFENPWPWDTGAHRNHGARRRKDHSWQRKKNVSFRFWTATWWCAPLHSIQEHVVPCFVGSVKSSTLCWLSQISCQSKISMLPTACACVHLQPWLHRPRYHCRCCRPMRVVSARYRDPSLFARDPAWPAEHCTPPSVLMEFSCLRFPTAVSSQRQRPAGEEEVGLSRAKHRTRVLIPVTGLQTNDSIDRKLLKRSR